MATKLTPYIVASRDAAVTGVASINGIQGDVTGAEAGLAASGVNSDITDLKGLTGPLSVGADGVANKDAVTVDQLNAAVADIESRNYFSTGLTSDGNITSNHTTTPTPAPGNILTGGNFVSMASTADGGAANMILSMQKTIGSNGTTGIMALSDSIDGATTTWAFPNKNKNVTAMAVGDYGIGTVPPAVGDSVFNQCVNNPNTGFLWTGNSSEIGSVPWSDIIYICHGADASGKANYGSVLQFSGSGDVYVAQIDTNTNPTGYTYKNHLVNENMLNLVRDAAELRAAELEKVLATERAARVALEARLVMLEEMHKDIVYDKE